MMGQSLAQTFAYLKLPAISALILLMSFILTHYNKPFFFVCVLLTIAQKTLIMLNL